jgi:hypothetical protein
VSEDMHMVDRDQTASTQTDCLGLPGWAMDGAHAGWCAPALIAVVFVGTGKHMGRYVWLRICLLRSSSCRQKEGRVQNWRTRAGRVDDWAGSSTLAGGRKGRKGILK